MPVRSKRPASVQLAGRSKTLRIGSDAKTFKGESLKQLQEYTNHWVIVFQHPDWSAEDTQYRIATAAAHLEGRALSMWANLPEQDRPETFKDFLKYLRGLVRDPANRTADAIRAI